MTNNFLVFGIVAGLGAVVLLIALLTQAFRSIGRGIAAMRARQDGSDAQFILWGLGVMLSVHLFNWFGITYWDQTYVIWFLHLAIISSLTAEVLRYPRRIVGVQSLSTTGRAMGKNAVPPVKAEVGGHRQTTVPPYKSRAVRRTGRSRLQ